MRTSSVCTRHLTCVQWIAYPTSPIKIAASKREEELCCVFSCLVLKYNRTKDSQHVNVGNRQGEALSLLSDVLKINFSGQLILTGLLAMIYKTT